MIYFVTESYLLTNTPITSNVDVDDYTPFIKTQSDQIIQPILGTYFYNDILTKYNAQTLSNDEETLVEYIQPCIAWYAAKDAAFGLSYQLKNKGVQQQFGDYSTQVTQSEVSFVMEHYEQKGSFYSRRLRNWLVDNKNLFPVFTSDNNKDSDLKPIISKCEGGNNYDNIMISF